MSTQDLQLYQYRPLFYRYSGLNSNRANDPRRRRPKFILHLHRFHHYKRLPRLHFITRLHVHSDDQSGHRRDQGRRTGRRCTRPGHFANGSTAFVEGLDLEPVVVGPDRVLTPPFPPGYGKAMKRSGDREQVNRCPFDLLEMSRHRTAVDLDSIRSEFDGDTLPIHLDDVLQVSSGTSAQTTSTCAVCGNMS